MKAQTPKAPPIENDPGRIAGQALRDLHTHFIPGARMRAYFGVDDDAWRAFSGFWDTLTQDRHMADNGAYRYRRYGQFDLDAGNSGMLRQLPHGPYEQPTYINPLNGGISRRFDPLLPEFADNALLKRILRALAAIFDYAQGYEAKWNIRLHPYRILAQTGKQGLPTPEGLHRDGVDFIVSMMIRRNNVEGGVTRITDSRGTVLFDLMLQAPLDILLADDAKTMHSVSAIVPLDPEQPAWRDVLVIAFTRIPPP